MRWAYRHGIVPAILSRPLGLVLLAVLALVLASPASADNWRASIREGGLPGHLVAVDKNSRAFHLFEKKSPLKVKYTFPCVTGQLAGDKQELNDLRTPEGIYFVEYKIASGLDFREYGGIAYTLNYPNPVDRLRGKTGHGIWIHSKGFGLVPTRGCVAIGLKDIDTVGPSLVPGTAVVLAEHLAPNIPQPDNGTALELRRLHHAWSEAWAARSKRMFDFYDAEAYSKGTESFAAFRQNKERLFKILNYIKIYNRDIYVLEGPDYWVTWAEQLYTASNLSTEGIRRLYWQRDKEGRFRIVGMEWTPRNLGMQLDVQKGRLVASAMPTQMTDAGSEAPVLPRVDMPESAAPTAENSQPAVAQPVPDPGLLAFKDPLVPRPVPMPSTGEIKWGGESQSAPQPNDAVSNARPAVPDNAPPPAAMPTPEAVAAPADQPARDARPTSAQPEPAQSQPAPVAEPAKPQPAQQQDAGQAAQPEPASPEAPDRANAGTGSVEKGATAALAVVQEWGRRFAARSGSIDELYDQKQFNRRAGVPRGQSFATGRRELERQFRQPWVTLISRPAQVEMQNGLAVVRQEQLVASPEGYRQGVRSFWIETDDAGSGKIVGMDFRQQELGLAADYLEEVSAAASEDIENWRKAWEAGRIDDYMASYTANAMQQGRYGAANIRRQKEALWARTTPVMVQLNGLRLSMDTRGLRADMNQVYADSSGHSDHGVKNLALVYDGSHWRIQNESWQPASPGAAATPQPANQNP